MIRSAFLSVLMTVAIMATPLLVSPAVADKVLVVTPSGEKVFRDKAVQSTPQANQKSAVSDIKAGAKPNIQLQLLDQIDQLQQEVQLLRGKVEELGHNFDRMQNSQRDRYIDLDRRITELSSQAIGVASSSAGTVASAKSDGAATKKLDVQDMDERKLYNTAQDFVQNRQFDQAIRAFNKLLEQYPNSQYIPNGHYWLGEVYMALPQPRLQEAKAHFLTILESYPDHPKVPATLYKLGKASDLMGDKQQAIKYLKKVVEQYPSSSSAGLARQYIQNLMEIN